MRSVRVALAAVVLAFGLTRKPPNHGAWCRYALDWDHIEAKWHLTVTQTEWNALVAMAATC